MHVSGGNILAAGFCQFDRSFPRTINQNRSIALNLLFFLTPKANCAYLYEDFTLRQALERMEHSGYAAIPIL